MFFCLISKQGLHAVEGSVLKDVIFPVEHVCVCVWWGIGGGGRQVAREMSPTLQLTKEIEEFWVWLQSVKGYLNMDYQGLDFVLYIPNLVETKAALN